MVLEWLRRQDPVLDAHLRTYLFTSEHDYRNRDRNRDRGREPPPLRPRRLARHREPEGSPTMNHLLRSARPYHRSRPGRNSRPRYKQRIVPTLAARKLVDFSGPLGWAHSATNFGRRLPPSPHPLLACGPTSAGCCRWPSCEPTSSSSAPSFSTSTGVPRTSTSPSSTPPRRLIAEAENVAVFHGWAAAGIVGIGGATTSARIPLGNDVAHYPRHVAKAVEQLL